MYAGSPFMTGITRYLRQMDGLIILLRVSRDSVHLDKICLLVAANKVTWQNKGSTEMFPWFMLKTIASETRHIFILLA